MQHFIDQMTRKNKQANTIPGFDNPAIRALLVVAAIIYIAARGYQFGQFLQHLLK